MDTQAEITFELKRKIIQYISLGYANWEIERKLQELGQMKKMTLRTIPKIRREYLTTLSEEKRKELENQINQRRRYNSCKSLIDKLKKGYTVEEMATIGVTNRDSTLCNMQEIENKIKKIIDWGLMKPEEIERAKQDRQNEKSKNLNLFSKEEERRKIVFYFPLIYF